MEGSQSFWFVKCDIKPKKIREMHTKVFLEAKIQYMSCKGKSKSPCAHPPQPDVTTANDWVCVRRPRNSGTDGWRALRAYFPEPRPAFRLKEVENFPERRKTWRVGHFGPNVSEVFFRVAAQARMGCLPRGSRAEHLLFTATRSKAGFNTWMCMHNRDLKSSISLWISVWFVTIITLPFTNCQVSRLTLQFFFCQLIYL